MLGERRWSILKKEEEEENMRHDESKKLMCKPQVVIVCIM